MLFFFEDIRQSCHLSCESALKYCFASWSVKKPHFLLGLSDGAEIKKKKKLFYVFIAAVTILGITASILILLYEVQCLLPRIIPLFLSGGGVLIALSVQLYYHLAVLFSDGQNEL